MAPFVTVIVPVYNDQTGIDRCLDALRTQSYPIDQYEVVVVDNNSNPPMRLGDSATANIKLAKCSKVGSYAARNTGINESHGEICAFTDADCVPRTDWLETGVAVLLENGGDCFVGGDVKYFLPESGHATELYQYLTGFGQHANVTERGFAATANLFAFRSYFDRVGLFDTELLSGGDLNWCLRASQKGIAAVFCEPATVETSARGDLSSAIRQARRVAGGRYHLRRSPLAASAGDRFKAQRGPLAAIGWILGRRDVSLIDRLRVLFVASIIKLAQVAETIRLRLGGKPERR